MWETNGIGKCSLTVMTGHDLGCLTLSVLIYFTKLKNMFAFSTISQWGVAIGTWDQPPLETRPYMSYTALTMSAGVLAMQGARAPRGLILV